MNNKCRFENNNKNRTAALLHTEEMEKRYNQNIIECASNTKTYNVHFGCDYVNKAFDTYEVFTLPTTSVDAAIKVGMNGAKTAILNFASYKHPGGMFIQGSNAQEENLCSESFLYNILKTFDKTYYAWNSRHTNKCLYLNRALYTPGVIFKNEYKFDVITCAAPNLRAAKKYYNITDEENALVLKSRIKFILDIARVNNVSNLILGAYGCGVFGQKPGVVATEFLSHLTNEHAGSFATVVFPIPMGHNFNVFNSIIGTYSMIL